MYYKYEDYEVPPHSETAQLQLCVSNVDQWNRKKNKTSFEYLLLPFKHSLENIISCMSKFTSWWTWKHTKSSISIHIWIEKEPHSAIFERPVKNEHWVLSFWCFVPTPPNADAQIQLSSHCIGFVADSALLSSVFKKSSTVIHNLLSLWYKDHWNRKLRKSQQIDYHARVRSKFEHNMFGVLHALQIKLSKRRWLWRECLIEEQGMLHQTKPKKINIRNLNMPF